MRTVIDLRTGDEVAKGRLRTGVGVVAWHHLPMLDVLPPREDYDAWVGPPYVAEQYLAMSTGARGPSPPFSGCSATRRPTRWCSTASPARTAPGSSPPWCSGCSAWRDEEIAADYALSQLAMSRLLEWLRAQYGERCDGLESSAAAIVAAEPETMAEFLDRFRAAYGSFEDYAARLGHPDAAVHLGPSCSSRKSPGRARRAGPGLGARRPTDAVSVLRSRRILAIRSVR